MTDLFEKTLLTGLGFLSLSQKKAEELLSELKEKYKISEDEGKVFLEKIQGMAQENRAKVTEMAEAEGKKVIEKLGMVSREEFDLLKKRVEALETRKENESGESC